MKSLAAFQLRSFGLQLRLVRIAEPPSVRIKEQKGTRMLQVDASSFVGDAGATDPFAAQGIWPCE